MNGERRTDYHRGTETQRFRRRNEQPQSNMSLRCTRRYEKTASSPRDCYPWASGTFPTTYYLLFRAEIWKKLLPLCSFSFLISASLCLRGEFASSSRIATNPLPESAPWAKLHNSAGNSCAPGWVVQPPFAGASIGGRGACLTGRRGFDAESARHWSILDNTWLIEI